MKHYKSVFLCFLLTIPHFIYAQIPTQIIRGQVTNAVSGSPLPGVHIVLENHTPLLGTITDVDGYFRLVGVPVGRQSIRFTFIGFEPQIVRDIMVTSSRETVLDVNLLESSTELNELVVTPRMSKEQPINHMAVSSARLLSMDEASRYAGGFDDPARLASSFAGVAGNLSDNAIVIRGNAPKGLLWRMEGVDIPTPSHFANIVTMGGGGITALSSQMISNSDFYTGAFPAEYGNALSGVFDLNIRNGNLQKHEHTVKLGAIGIDLASEGPISSSRNASYLINYRLSTFSLIAPLLPDDAGDIRYQNLSFKIHVPTSKSGTFSFWGLGASDWSGSSADNTPGTWIYNQDRESVESPTKFGVLGLRHRLLLGDHAYLTSTVAASGNGLSWEIDRYTDDGMTLYRRESVFNESGRLTARSVLNYSFGPNHSNRTGLTINRLGYNQNIRYSHQPESPLQTVSDEMGSSVLYQGFTQSRFDFGRMVITGGMYFQHFELTNVTSAEPRIGLQLNHGKNLYSLSYGRHTQIEPLSVYFSHDQNRSLNPTKADHVVLGFSHMINQHFQIKAETYYQYLSDVPVIDGSSFSLLNLELDWFISDALQNSGKGRNYGVELSLERYLYNGWHGLINGSLFQSEYQGGDGHWRNTRFNRGYTMVFLGGKEWQFRSDERVRFLSVNGRINLMGGKRISPVDIQKSQFEKEVYYDENRAFTNQEPAVFYSDLTVELRTIRKKISTVWSLQMINITGYQEFYGHRYNLRTGTIDEEREMIMIPNISYKIEF